MNVKELFKSLEQNERVQEIYKNLLEQDVMKGCVADPYTIGEMKTFGVVDMKLEDALLRLAAYRYLIEEQN